MRRAIISVELKGPPSVRVMLTSNTMNERTMAKNRQMVMEERIMGRRTLRSTDQALAPSTRAASTSSAGTLVKPAT